MQGTLRGIVHVPLARRAPGNLKGSLSRPLSLPWGNLPVGVVMLERGETDLLQVVDAMRATCGLIRRLHRRQEQANQDPNDGDHDQQLD